jgi:glutamine synthetase
LRANEVFRAGFGAAFVDYYTHIKAAELERFENEAGEQPEVTPWEQKEYLDFF